MDGRDEREVFSANLVMGKTQYREVTRRLPPASMNILLTHHPLEWISSTHGRWLKSAFASVPSLHLCGHVHQHTGTTTFRLGKQNNSFTMVAGASHSGPGEAAAHAYSRCILRRDPVGRWQLGWSPRVYDPDRDGFRIDGGDHDLDPSGFAWFSFGGQEALHGAQH
jgi:hypothetical protein